MRLFIFLTILVGFTLFSCTTGSVSETVDTPENVATGDPIAGTETPVILPEVATPTEPLYVSLLINDGVYNTELTAPMDIFHHTKFRGENHLIVYTIAKDYGIITTFEGLKITPDHTLNDGELPPCDILVVPSAEHHLDTDLEDTLMLNYIRYAAAEADWVMSHCDGAFMLAAAGLLEGRECTTFPGDIEAMREMFPDLIVHDDVLFVHDGKFITSAGGAKSFEASLYLHELLCGKEATELTAEGLVIDWDVNKIPCVIVR
jgi:transcriptional regulator GlxA family with amidase domain